MKKISFGVAALLAFISAVNGAEPKSFAIEGGPFQIAPEYPLASLRIPLTPLADLKGEKPVISVANVHFRNRSDAVLLSAFHDAAWEDDKLEAIVMKVDTKVINEKGSYELILALRPADPKSAFKPERIKTTVTLPEARLRAVEKLLIRRVWTFIGSHEDTVVPLPLEETTNAAFLTNIKVRPSRIATFSNRQVTGHLDFFSPHANAPLDPQKLIIPPGGILPLEYKLKGDFPLGLVTGALEISAPQLSTPLAVPFEVASRLCRGYIFLVLVLGLVLSYLVKVRLQRAIDLGEARQQGAGVLQRVRDEFERRHDQEFRAALSQEIENFENLLQGKEPVPLTAASKKLDDLLRTELTKLAKKNDDMQARVDEFRLVTDNDWPLPDSLTAAIADAKQNVDRAAEGLKSDAIEEAGKLLETARAKLARAIIDGLPAWQNEVKNVLEDLGKATSGISASLQAEFVQHAEPAKTALGGAALDDPGAGMKAIKELLPNVVRERRLATDPLHWLAQAMKAEAATHIAALREFTLPDQMALDGLEQTIRAFSELLSTLADRPKDATATLPAELAKIQSSWLSALTNQVPAAANAIGTLVGERKYSEAAKAVQTLLKGQQPAVALGGAASRLAGHLPQWMVGTDLLPPMVSFRTGSALGVQPEPLAALKLRSASEIREAKFWQTLIIGLLVALFGYITYQEKFIGDFMDFATIFFWAFGVDVSIDTLLKVVLPKRS